MKREELLPPDLRRRYGRQIRLTEIGEAGQAKLCAMETSLVAKDGFARTIEERYVRLAGMRVRVTEDGAVGDASEPSAAANVEVTLGLRHQAAREVGEGALYALIAVRTALGMTRPPQAERGGGEPP